MSRRACQRCSSAHHRRRHRWRDRRSSGGRSRRGPRRAAARLAHAGSYRLSRSCRVVPAIEDAIQVMLLACDPCARARADSSPPPAASTSILDFDAPDVLASTRTARRLAITGCAHSGLLGCDTTAAGHMEVVVDGLRYVVPERPPGALELFPSAAFQWVRPSPDSATLEAAFTRDGLDPVRGAQLVRPRADRANRWAGGPRARARPDDVHGAPRCGGLRNHDDPVRRRAGERGCHEPRPGDPRRSPR